MGLCRKITNDIRCRRKPLVVCVKSANCFNPLVFVLASPKPYTKYKRKFNRSAHLYQVSDSMRGTVSCAVGVKGNEAVVDMTTNWSETKMSSLFLNTIEVPMVGSYLAEIVSTLVQCVWNIADLRGLILLMGFKLKAPALCRRTRTEEVCATVMCIPFDQLSFKVLTF